MVWSPSSGVLFRRVWSLSVCSVRGPGQDLLERRSHYFNYITHSFWEKFLISIGRFSKAF